MLVHPAMSPRYYGFYLDGFRQAYGWKVRLATEGFPRLSDPKSGLAAILPTGQRIFIAANDFSFVDPGVVAWADVVGQVNVDPEADRSDKVLPIGPSFGTPWLSRSALVGHILGAGLKADPRRIPARLRDYLKHQQERTPLAAYRPSKSEDSYIFFVTNYWAHADEANLRRLAFVRAARQHLGAGFSGGFWHTKALPSEFQEFRIEERVPHSEWLQRMARSGVAFNTPAVHDCLGWKLGEFMALGKAVLSTPLRRVMPGQFQPGEHIHEVEDDPEAIADGMTTLLEDDAYRVRLEKNARQYWNDYLAPTSVARRLVEGADRSG